MHRATPLNTSFRSFAAGGSRGTVTKADDSQFMQGMAGNFHMGESRGGIESPQNYGFTSVVMPAEMDEATGKIMNCAETFISFMGGNRSFPVAGNMDDRRHRLMNLAEGDVGMFRTAVDKLQFHFSKDGGFMTGPNDKTVRMQLLTSNSGEDGYVQGGGGGSGGGGSGLHDGSGGGGGNGGGQQQKKMGQKSVTAEGQKSKLFVHLTKDEAASSGTNVRHYLDDGNGYYEVNADKNVYCGALKGKGQFAKVVTLKGPAKNVLGKIG